MLYTLPANVTVPTPGTPVRLASARTPATYVVVTAIDDNAAVVYVGGPDPSSKQTAGVSETGKRGVQLLGGNSFVFPQVSVPSPYDLHEMWVDAESANDGVSVTYLVR